METSPSEVKPGPSDNGLLDPFVRIFHTGFSELKRKSTITRLHFEIKSFEKEKQKHVRVLGNRAWEAHVEHPDIAGIIVHLKELQIEMNRLKTQFGEHDTQIKDIEVTKAELTEKFNQELDRLEQQIVPHRQMIETTNAEKEDNKVQIEELRTKQDELSQQVRVHQKNIQEFDLGDDAGKTQKIELEKTAIRDIHQEHTQADCRLPFLMSNLEKLKITLSNEKSAIERLEQEKETSKRHYEQRIKDYNAETTQLEEKKKQCSRQIETFRREMDPFLHELGRKMEQLRLQEHNFPDNFHEVDQVNKEIQQRLKQITEAESLSRAMDRGAWNKFLMFSGGVVLLFVTLAFLLFHI